IFHARENAAMFFETEVFDIDRAGDLEEEDVVQQDRAEDEAFSVEIRGETFFEGQIRGRVCRSVCHVGCSLTLRDSCSGSNPFLGFCFRAVTWWINLWKSAFVGSHAK